MKKGGEKMPESNFEKEERDQRDKDQEDRIRRDQIKENLRGLIAEFD